MSNQFRINDEEAARAALKAYREARGYEDTDYNDTLELCVALPVLLSQFNAEELKYEINSRL